MKANISRGSGFSGLCRYVLDLKSGEGKGAKKAEVIGGNIAGNRYGDIMSSFTVVQKIRPDITRPVWHCSLSFPPGEKPNNETLAKIAAEFMLRMGFPEVNPYTVIRHHDTAHDHIHIVASRIGLDGKVWQGAFEALKAMKITQELEKEFSLTLTEGYNKNADRKNPKFGERRMEDRTGQVSPKVQLQELIDEIIATGPTVVEFCEYLEASGVEVRANLASTGKLNGFSFAVEGIAFKGSNLGKAYTWVHLQERGVNYSQTRDLAGLSRFAAGTGRRPAPSKEAVAVATSRLRGLLDKISAKRPTIIEFCDFLWASMVKVWVYLTKARELIGLSFTVDDVPIGRSQGKPAQIWETLKKRGVSYDPDRDFDSLREVIKRQHSPVPMPSVTEGDPGALKKGSQKRSSTEPWKDEFSQQPKNRLKRLISEAVLRRPTAPEFCALLAVQGVIAQPNLAKTGKLSGFTFTIDGVTFKGSSLGKAFSWKGLQDKGVTYESERDRESLERYKTGSPAQPAADGAATSAGGIKKGYRGPASGSRHGGGPIYGRSRKGESEFDEDDSGFGDGDRPSEADSDSIRKVSWRDEGAYSEIEGDEQEYNRESDKRFSTGGDFHRDGVNGVFTKNIRIAIEEKKELEKREALKKKWLQEKARREERQEELDEEDDVIIFGQSNFDFVGRVCQVNRLPQWVEEIFIVKRYKEEESYYLYPRNGLRNEAALIVWANCITVKRMDEETIFNGLRLGKDIWPPEKKIKIVGDDQFRAMVRYVVEKYGFDFYFPSDCDSEMRFLPKQEQRPEKSKPMLEPTSERSKQEPKPELEPELKPERPTPRFRPR